jgi:hypothetical protein
VSAYLRRNALALVALFFGLSGGVAWATHPGGANTISSLDIINGEVKGVDVAPNAIRTGRIEDGTLTTDDVADDSLRSEDILDGQIRAIDVAFATLRGDEILDGTISGNDIVDDGLSGDDVNESTLHEVPSATTADTAAIGLALEEDQIEVNTNSIVVPGGNQDDSNGNGISRAVSVSCDTAISGGDVAIGGGAYWSGNANSNSDELENRIHSMTYLDATGDVATNGEIPRGIRVRGEVDKDGNDTLTAQVLCFPAF